MLNIIETVRRAISPASSAPTEALQPAASVAPSPSASSLFTPEAWAITDFSERAAHNTEVKALWRAFVKHSKPTAAQLAARNILLGRRADKGFSPITNPIRLANGHAPYAGFDQAMWSIQNDPSAWLPWKAHWVNETPKGWSDKMVAVWGQAANKALLAHIEAKRSALKGAA